MMALRDVDAAVKTLLQLANTIKSLGDGRYRQSPSWREFPSQVQLLCEKHADLEAQEKRYGWQQDTDPSVLDDLEARLEEAKRLLSGEEATLRARERKARDANSRWGNIRIGASRGRRGEIVFPAEVGRAVQNATKVYDRFLPEYSRSQQENEQTAALQRRPIPLSFRREDPYVPLEAESMVYSALQGSEDGSPTLVFLCGGSGRGKSTVARHISLTYREEKFNPIFCHVVMLECGQEVDAQAKQMELLQKLGWNVLSDATEASSDKNVKLARLESFPKKDMQHVLGLARLPSLLKQQMSRLQNVLKEPKLLIVLDDLWDSEFLQTLLNLSGSNVKYLVTSQDEDLCKDLICERKVMIRIDDLQQDNSKGIPRKILAAHVGFLRGVIPDYLKDVVDEILDQAEGIPLTIATLGAQIGSADKNDVKEWKSALNDFSHCLNHYKSSNSAYGTQKPLLSYWSAMKQSIDGLGRNEKNLLSLIGMCKDPSVPQGILQVFCAFLFTDENCDTFHFSQWKKQLESRQLVSERRPNLLSVHTLTKEFIAEQMRETVESVRGLFSDSFVNDSNSGKHLNFVRHANAPSSEETRVVRVLVCLYLDRRFSEPVAKEIGHDLGTFSETKRRIIDPIIELLVHLELNSGEMVDARDLHTAARQVFLEFIYRSALDYDHISQLLGHPAGVVQTLQFLDNASLLEGSFWQKNTIRDISDSLLRVFQDTTRPDFQVKAAITLAALCVCNNQTRDNILHTPGMLDHLVQSLYKDRDPDLQSGAALLVSSATSLSGTDTLVEIMDFPKMMDVLLKPLVADHQNLILQANVAAAFGNLACGDSIIKGKIAYFPNLLETLAMSLSNVSNPVLVTWLVEIQ